jgi:heme-degrading monooxygenase HmoA
MTFREEETENFLKIFNGSSSLIRNFQGCQRLELLRDKNDPRIFFTYSHWNAENDLQNYRHSELFAQVWSRTKVLFAEKPEAWSVSREQIIP